MSSKSKNKGKAFEREICNFLSALYGENFERVPYSGAFIGGSNSYRKTTLTENQKKSFKGDIIPPDDWKFLNAEAKNYADFPFHQLFSGSVKLLDSWIEQCLDPADPEDFNIIFMKFNRKGTYIAAEMKKIDTAFNYDNHFIYQGPNNTSWLIMEHTRFWQLNAERVKKICKENEKNL